ncbi:flavin reductase family protein [Mariniblastus fucicola]|uniref:Flavin reductase like domain protein n=1 Tax=Mariniblastus fucicola TaxID=980251 RepID=A0A5B9P8Y1_9BACT|nr:flavin reductase family protein [Mariniblastus fucicola]QEG23197.1 Flavin reductase like domain protein [Mariniblastus fucicola]
MQFDPTDMGIRDIYTLMVQLITPRPIAWVSSVSKDGVTNLAPYSFFNGIGANPPSVLFCPVNRRDGSQKDSLLNVLDTKEFVVNVVSFSDAELMNKTSADYGSEVSEFEALDIETLSSEKVAPLRVASSLAQFECRLLKHLELASGPAGANVVIGEIVMLHVDDSIIEDGVVDPAKLDTVGRLGGKAYSRTTDRFELERPPVPE